MSAPGLSCLSVSFFTACPEAADCRAADSLSRGMLMGCFQRGQLLRELHIRASVGRLKPLREHAMKTTLLSVAAGVLASLCPIPGSAQQNGEDGYRPAQSDGYNTPNRGDYGRRSDERQNNQYTDRGNDRWRGTNSNTSERGGARFRFSRGNATIDIKCPPNEPLQNCVEAASRLIDKVHSLGPTPENRQGPGPGPESRPGAGVTPNQQ